MKKGAPPCGLYMRIGPDPDMDVILPALRQAAFAINRSDYEKNMHVVEIDPSVRDGEGWGKTTALVQLARMEGLAVLIKGDLDAAVASKADGVLLPPGADIGPARTLLGEEGIIGVECPPVKEEAEKIAADGIDYIAFGFAGSAMPPPLDIFKWWSTRTAVPALACGDITNDEAGDYAAAGAMFVDCSRYLWTYEKGAMQATVNMLYALDLAAGSVRPN